MMHTTKRKLPSWAWAIILYIGGIGSVALFTFPLHYLLMGHV